jgi:hypothetical protein
MGKRQPAREKTPRLGKRSLALALGDACIWEMLKSMKMMMGENQSSQSQVQVTVFWGTEGLAPKSQFK